MKKAIISMMFLLVALCGSAQSTDNERPYVKNRFNIGAGVLLTDLSAEKVMFTINADYGITKWFEAGLYLSNWISAKHEFYETNPDNTTTYFRPFALEYGADLKGHLLPVVVRPSFYWADVYLDVQVGLCTTFSNGYMDMANKTRFMAGATIGAAFNFTRSIGVFYEFGYSNINKMSHRFGSNVRFVRK